MFQLAFRTRRVRVPAVPRYLAPLALLLFLSASPAALAQASAAETAILPPVIPWDGASRSLVVADDDPWITPAERTGLTATPSYDETVAYLRRLTAAAPELEMIPFGSTAEGRTLWLVIASADRAFTPEALRRTGKPVILVQAGIHSGEIDGKDAGLMLLRDLTVRGAQRELLDRASLLFIPVLNADGHERRSRFGRINQRGPVAMGWRTNGRNLNLNRDYAKADTPAIQALLRLLDRWPVDLYLDLHVTDGLDYQYDITWGATGPHAYSPAIATFLRQVLDPAVAQDLKAQGHIPGPLVLSEEPEDLRENGLIDWTGSPRFSNVYGDARHLPTILVENHSLKPYDQRVLGTYVLLESVLRLMGREGEALRQSVDRDRARRPERVTLSWKLSEKPLRQMTFLGIGHRIEPSKVSGGTKVVWTGEPVSFEVPVFGTTVPEGTVTRPAAYWIPPDWPEVIERLALHGVEMEVLTEPRELEVEMYRLEDVELADRPFEGHVRVGARPVPERRRERFPAGSVRISTDQPRGELAALLLEPGSPDSFFQWGFFLEVLQRTEYVEGYVMEPMAERMLEEDPALRAAFEKKLAEDEAFRSDPQERLQWLYRRTPFFDQRWRLYPVAREP